MCNLLAPPEARPSLFALHAFNIETAKMRAANTETAIGRHPLRLSPIAMLHRRRPHGCPSCDRCPS